MRALKTVVVVLSALIIMAFGVLVYGLSQNWQHANHSTAATEPAPAAGKPSSVKMWGKAGLGLPADSHIQSVTPAGSLVVVHVVSGSDERLLVLDPATGTVVGTFGVTEKP
jgi:hypothetical protein